ncbi:unnamed protein product [Camellia sinensis]
MPKKLPTPKSSPSKGTNSVTMSSSTAIETDQNRNSVNLYAYEPSHHMDQCTGSATRTFCEDDLSR